MSVRFLLDSALKCWPPAKGCGKELDEEISLLNYLSFFAR